MKINHFVFLLSLLTQVIEAFGNHKADSSSRGSCGGNTPLEITLSLEEFYSAGGRQKLADLLAHELHRREKSGESLADLEIETMLSITQQTQESASYSTKESTTPPRNTTATTIAATTSSTSIASETAGTTEEKEATRPNGEKCDQFNITAELNFTSCPVTCDQLSSSSSLNYRWCLDKTHCVCNNSIVRPLEGYSRRKCFVAVGKNCTEVCDFLHDNQNVVTIPSGGISTGKVLAKATHRTMMHCDCRKDSPGVPKTYGWLIAQRRKPKGNFQCSDQNCYEKRIWGIGKHYWLGLDMLHSLTVNGSLMQIELGKKNTSGRMEYFYIRYSNFTIGNKSSGYQLTADKDPSFHGEDLKLLDDVLDPCQKNPIFEVRNGSGWWLTNASNLNADWSLEKIAWGNEKYDEVVMKILPGYATEAVICNQSIQNCRSMCNHSKTIRFVALSENGTTGCMMLDGTAKQVYCDCSETTGGWMVIQRRINDGIDFSHRCKREYERGFGDLSNGSFWLGLNSIRNLNGTLLLQMRRNHIIYCMLYKYENGMLIYEETPCDTYGNTSLDLPLKNKSDNEDREFELGQSHRASCEVTSGWWWPSNSSLACSLNGPYVGDNGVGWFGPGGDNVVYYDTVEMKLCPNRWDCA